jgi:hypothetical protein
LRPGALAARGGQRRRLGPHEAIPAALLLACAALRLLTWRPLADGPLAPFAAATLLSAGAAAVVWALFRAQLAAPSWRPLLPAAALLLCADSVHYIRLASPIVRGQPALAWRHTAAEQAPRHWELSASAGGAARVEDGALLLESPPGATAAARARLGALPDPRRHWWLPLGLESADRVERLEWRARVERTGRYFVVMSVRDLLIQAVEYGVHVTYPDAAGASRGHEIPHPLGADAQPHDWQVTRTRRDITLRLDGQQVWSAPQRGELNQLVLGETRPDPQHGGSLRVEAAAYTITLVPR